jgi:hypothetical protein
MYNPSRSPNNDGCLKTVFGLISYFSFFDEKAVKFSIFITQEMGFIIQLKNYKTFQSPDHLLVNKEWQKLSLNYSSISKSLSVEINNRVVFSYTLIEDNSTAATTTATTTENEPEKKEKEVNQLKICTAELISTIDTSPSLQIVNWVGSIKYVNIEKLSNKKVVGSISLDEGSNSIVLFTSKTSLRPSESSNEMNAESSSTKSNLDNVIKGQLYGDFIWSELTIESEIDRLNVLNSTGFEKVQVGPDTTLEEFSNNYLTRLATAARSYLDIKELPLRKTVAEYYTNIIDSSLLHFILIRSCLNQASSLLINENISTAKISITVIIDTLLSILEANFGYLLDSGISSCLNEKLNTVPETLLLPDLYVSIVQFVFTEYCPLESTLKEQLVDKCLSTLVKGFKVL